jgi:hypothetical protein
MIQPAKSNRPLLLDERTIAIHFLAKDAATWLSLMIEHRAEQSNARFLPTISPSPDISRDHCVGTGAAPDSDLVAVSVLGFGGYERAARGKRV